MLRDDLDPQLREDVADIQESCRAMARTIEALLAHGDGPGVPPEVAGRVFEPGFRTRGSSGLGLALARRVARSVGGDLVLVEDPIVPDATFDLVVPRA